MPRHAEGAAGTGLQVTRYDFLHEIEHVEQLGEDGDLFGSRVWFEVFERELVRDGDRIAWYVATDPATGPVVALPAWWHGDGSGGPRGARLTALSNFYTAVLRPLVNAHHGDLAAGVWAAGQALALDAAATGVLDLAPMDREPPVFRCLCDVLRASGWLTQRYFCFGNWYAPVTGMSFQDYAAARPGRLRSSLRRKLGQLERDSSSRVEILTSSADVSRGLAAYWRVYARSWKKPEPHPSFINALAREAAEAGWLRLGIYWHGERPVAGQLWFVRGGVASIFKLAYDHDFGALSPGSVLTWRLAEQVIENDGVHEIDYLSGDDAYKRDWMSHRRERWGVRAFRRRSPLALVGAARHFGGHMLRSTFAPGLRAMSAQRGERNPRPAGGVDAADPGGNPLRPGHPGASVTGWLALPAAELQHRGGEWWAEAQQGAAPENPLLERDFIAPLAELFAGEHTRLLVRRDAGGRVDAALLLEPAGMGRWRTFLPSQLPVSPVLAASDALPDVLDGVVPLLGKAAWMVSCLYLDELTNPSLPAVAARGERFQHHATMSVSSNGSFDAYWEQRPKKLRSNVKRYTNRAARDGIGLGLVEAAAPTEMAYWVREYAQLESQGWKGRRGTALGEADDQGRFYRRVMERFAERGRARVFALCDHGKPIAMRLVIESRSMAVMLKTTYDESLSAYAPGRLLLHRVLQWYFEQSPVERVEFYTQANKDQLEWSTHSRPIEHLDWYTAPFLKQCVHLVRRIRSGAGQGRTGAGESAAGEVD